MLANGQALDLSFEAFTSNDSIIALMPGVSHALWGEERRAGGGGSLWPVDHSESATSTSGYGREEICCDTISWTRAEEPATEDKKAEGDS